MFSLQIRTIGRFPHSKISMGSEIKPAHAWAFGTNFLFQFEPVIRNPDDKELKHFQLFFGPAVRIIQDGKKSSPIRSDAYFPEWKPALSLDLGPVVRKVDSANHRIVTFFNRRKNA